MPVPAKYVLDRKIFIRQTLLSSENKAQNIRRTSHFRRRTDARKECSYDTRQPWSKRRKRELKKLQVHTHLMQKKIIRLNLPLIPHEHMQISNIEKKKYTLQNQQPNTYFLQLFTFFGGYLMYNTLFVLQSQPSIKTNSPYHHFTHLQTYSNSTLHPRHPHLGTAH